MKTTLTTSPRRATAAVISLLALFPLAGWAQATAPGDVYYSAHVVQTFKYYVFANDFVEWTNETYADTSLSQTATHDTTTAISNVSIATALEAHAGHFTADLASEVTAQARTGIYNEGYNDLDLDIYVRGPAGTPYDITVVVTGTLEASRLGGLPGSLQPVNGTSWADFDGTNLTVSNGGADTLAVAVTDTLSGTSTLEILVNGEVYSLARTFSHTSGSSVTQNVCILGCMTQAADFHALVDAHVVIDTYLQGLPTGVHDTPHTPVPLALHASPNPLNSSTVVSFEARGGARTTIDVFDVRGRRVAALFDAAATGSVQTLPWNASTLPSGVYFLRAADGHASATKKLVVLK